MKSTIKYFGATNNCRYDDNRQRRLRLHHRDLWDCRNEMSMRSIIALKSSSELCGSIIVRLYWRRVYLHNAYTQQCNIVVVDWMVWWWWKCWWCDDDDVSILISVLQFCFWFTAQRHRASQLDGNHSAILMVDTFRSLPHRSLENTKFSGASRIYCAVSGEWVERWVMYPSA